MEGVTWVFSSVLAVVFLVVGVQKALRYEKALKMFSWVKHVPRPLAQAIGVAEILGALGLIVPAATGSYPWLTPLAAIGLAALMVASIIFHGTRRESDEVTLNAVILLLLVIVIVGRWALMP